MDFRVFDNGLQELSDQLDLHQQRCFMYGDGHFTTALVVKGEIEHLSLHLERLKLAHKQLKMNPLLWAKLATTMADMALPHHLAVIKVQISRGQAQRGYGQTLRTHPAIFITITPMAEDALEAFKQPIDLPVLTTQLAIQPLLAGIKHCNRLEQVLIANELEQLGAEDGLVLDLTGRVTETSKANIFCYSQGQWFTPDLTNAGVAGVMRQHILTVVNAQQSAFSLTDILPNLEAAFICNSLIGVRPVERFAGKTLETEPVALVQQALKRI